MSPEPFGSGSASSPSCAAEGIGGAIYDHVETRLRAEGAARIETAPNDDEQGRRFLVSRRVG